MTASPWTEDRIQRLRALWGKGLSASEIAARLAVSRNAVLGKLHRLKLLGGRSGRAATTRSRQQSPTAGAGIRPPARVPPRRDRSVAVMTLEPPGLVNRVEGLGRHLCRWPIGDPLSAAFSFCGRSASYGPYCLDHRRVAYRPRAVVGARHSGC